MERRAELVAPTIARVRTEPNGDGTRSSIGASSTGKSRGISDKKPSCTCRSGSRTRPSGRALYSGPLRTPALRHDMVAAGIDLTRIIDAGGWNDPKMPRYYTRATEGE